MSLALFIKVNVKVVKTIFSSVKDCEYSTAEGTLKCKIFIVTSMRLKECQTSDRLSSERLGQQLTDTYSKYLQQILTANHWPEVRDP